MDKILEAWGRLDSQTYSAIWLIIIILLIMTLICIIANVSIKRHRLGQKPTWFLSFIMFFAGGMKNLIDENMGKRFRFLGPYLMFIMVFYLVSVSLGFFGIPVAITFLSIPLTLALVMLAVNWTLSIKDYKIGFFLKFIKNPLNLTGEIAPIISMTFRIFGNILAGAVLIALVDTLMGTLQHSLIGMQDWNFLGPIIVAPLRLYFDVFAGLVQAYIFTLLTVIYIGLAVKPEEEIETQQKKKKKNKSQELIIRREKKQDLEKAHIV